MKERCGKLNNLREKTINLLNEKLVKSNILLGITVSANVTSLTEDYLLLDNIVGAHDNIGRSYRDDSSGSDDGEVVTFIVGSEPSSLRLSSVPIPTVASSPMSYPVSHSSLNSLAAQNSSHPMSTSINESSPSVQDDNVRASPLAMNQDKVVIPLPRTKKSPATSQTSLVKCVPPPMPPPRRVNSHLSFTFNSLNRAQSTDVEPMESTSSSIVSSTTSAHGDTQPEDTYSTDSSSFDGEFKKRRRKLHFPFGKKSSHKNKNA